MLPEPTVPPSLMALLKELGTFTSPSRRTFAALVTGLVAATGKRTVTGMLGAAGLSRAWSHDRVHAFFSRAAWNPETLGLALSHLIVRALLPDGAALSVAVDDRCSSARARRCSGRRGSTTARPRCHRSGRGTCFVVLGLIVELPFLTRPACLPVMARPWRPKAGPSKAELAASMIRLLAVCHHTRAVHVVADAAYHGPALRHLPETISIHHAAADERGALPPGARRAPDGADARRSRVPAWVPPHNWPPSCSSPPRGSSAMAAPTPCTSPRSDACGTGPSTPSRRA